MGPPEGNETVEVPTLSIAAMGSETATYWATEETMNNDLAGASPVDQPVRRIGPTLTDQDGNLQVAILMCAWGEHRCANYSVHDWHYEYCAGLPDSAPNLRPGYGELIRGHPGDRCPCKDA